MGNPYPGAWAVQAQPLNAYYPRYTPGNYQTFAFGSQAQPLISQEQAAPFLRQAQATKPELGLAVDTSFGKYTVYV